jgi:hypothetical protein
MYTINSVAVLKEAIIDLEIKKKRQASIIKEQFDVMKENLSPANIIKSTFDEVAASPTLRSNLLGALVGLGAAYFSRKLVIGKSGNLIRKILGSVLQLGIGAVVASKPTILQNIGQTIVKRVFTKKNSYEPTNHQRN